MANYVKSTELLSQGELKRCYWVHGRDRGLVERFVDRLRQAVAPHDLDHLTLRVGDAKPADIWAAITTYPLDPTTRRLVVVREANRLRDLSPIDHWLDDRLIPQVVACFVDEGETENHIERLARITKSGRQVRCTPTEDEAVEIISRRCSGGGRDARDILAHTAGSVSRALGILDKLEACRLPLEHRAVSLIDEPIPTEQFVDSLVRMDKTACLASIPVVDEDDLARIISFLERRLAQMSYLHRATTRGASYRDLLKDGRVPAFLLPRLLPTSKHYTREGVAARIRLLALLDAAVQRGSRECVLETLVAAW